MRGRGQQASPEIERHEIHGGNDIIIPQSDDSDSAASHGDH